MGLLGTIILLFLVVHLRHFWVEARFLQSINEENTMFTVMLAVFQSPMAVALYVLGCLSLSYHLLHGFQSAFQTLGVNHKSYTPIIQSVGTWFSIIIPLLFASMPVTIFLGLIK
jgi:succinate dehydrogenase / fumarate reductase cytochrome b subunit